MNQTPLIHLVVDDAAVRESLALLIGTVGLRVQGWAHPQAFLDGFDREAIGAVVLDVRLPGLSGLQVLDTLQAQGADQPVILRTGHGTVAMCRRAFKAGAVEFLEKPVDDQALLDALQAAVRQHGRSRQHHQADREARAPRAAQPARARGAGPHRGRSHQQGDRPGADTETAHCGDAPRDLFGKLGAPSLAQPILRYAQLVDDDAGRGAAPPSPGLPAAAP